MVSTKWADPGQPEDGQFGWYRGTPSRPNVDGSFLFSHGVRSVVLSLPAPVERSGLGSKGLPTSAVPTSGDVDSDFVFGGTNAG